MVFDGHDLRGLSPAAMNRLVVEGVQVGVTGPRWETQPPDHGLGDDGEIRTGPRLKASP